METFWKYEIFCGTSATAAAITLFRLTIACKTETANTPLRLTITCTIDAANHMWSLAWTN